MAPGTKQPSGATGQPPSSAGAEIPASLHPVIDPNACICSGACIAVCPEGDIIQIVGNTAKLVNASQCIGHGACANACPVDAIRLVFGSSERGLDLPELSLGFESSRLGVHIVGELGGMGLIKNALRQGFEVANYLHRKLGAPTSTSDLYDVVIVGAGPAGLATALVCRTHGLNFYLFDQGTFGGTVANYPRHKIVMTEPVDLPYYGRFGAATIKKETLLGIWQQACTKAEVVVHENTMLQNIAGEDGAFEVVTNQGKLRARKVVMACGRRGTPRKLDVKGEELPHVAYQLVNPEQYNGAHVLVIGGGDVALESAIMLCEQSSARVALSYRGEKVQRARAANLTKFKNLVATGQLHVYFKSTVQFIKPKILRLAHKGRLLEMPIDYLLVHVGGTLPDALLEKLKLSSKRHFGKEEQPIPGHSRDERERNKTLFFAGLTIFSMLLFCLVSLVFFAVLGYAGLEYYKAPVRLRMNLAEHGVLRPAGSVGKMLGAVATFVMSLNFVYAVRKRVARLQNFGDLRDWLNLHMLVGAVTPLFVAFHAAFQSNNMVASGTAVALTGVVLTGMVGRFMYTLAPTENQQVTALPELMAQWEDLRRETHKESIDLELSGDFTQINAKHMTLPPQSQSVLASMVRLCATFLSMGKELLHARRHFKNSYEWFHFALRLLRLLHLRAQVSAYQPFRRMLQIWRMMHLVLSSALVLIMVLHISIVVHLGYGWSLK